MFVLIYFFCVLVHAKDRDYEMSVSLHSTVELLSSKVRD